ncbi:MAG: domain protein DegV family [Clostridia bacterium]|nr:domain protein DegV family [Clostridia bacterium]
MINNVLITADSTCDLSQELIKKHNIKIVPIYISMGSKFYKDGIDITQKDIYEFVAKNNQLPKTAAIGPIEYAEIFKPLVEKGLEIIHVSIGSKFSSCFQNACLAAEEYAGKVHIVDSANLSSGSGHVVLELADLLEAGVSVSETLEKIKTIIPKVDASFILDNLEYMHKGGRCSSITALGANFLKLKPCIEVVDGVMEVGKKYRGNLPIVLKKYVEDRLINTKDYYKKNRIFITSTCQTNELIDMVKDEIKKAQIFDEIFVTPAGCTITCHCGPNTLGILFIRN